MWVDDRGLGGWNIARSGDHINRFARRVLGGQLGVVHAVIQEMQGRLRVMLRIERHVESGLGQRQAKQFTLAGAVFDQENGGMRHHIYRRTSAGNMLGSKMNYEILK